MSAAAITLPEWLQALEDAESRERTRPPNSVTAKELSLALGISISRAEKRLKSYVANGKARKRLLVIDGHLANVYVPVEAHDAAHSHDGHIGRMDRVG